MRITSPFAKGYQGERVSQINLKPFLEEIASGAKLRKPDVRLYLVAADYLHILVKPRAFKRCVTNLVNNACNHASEVTVTAQQEEGNIIVSVSTTAPVSRRKIGRMYSARSSVWMTPATCKWGAPGWVWRLREILRAVMAAILY